MSRVRQFFQTAFTYFAGNIFSKLVTFFMIPLYTNQLPPSEYGDYDFVVTIITFFISVAFFQIWDGMFRFSFDCRDKEERYRILCDAVYIYIAGIFVYFLLFFIAWHIVGFKNPTYVFFYGLLLGLQYLYSFMARAFLKNKLFAYSGAVNTFLAALCNLVFILKWKMGISSLYLAQMLGCLAQILLIEMSLQVLKRVVKHKPDVRRIKQMLIFSVPLCVSAISYWLLSGFTKLVINRELGAYENGIYAIANSLANTAIIAVNVFQFAWNEMAYMIAKEENRTSTYRKCVDLLFTTVSFGCAALCIGIKIVFPYLVGREYNSASEVVPILMIGVSANAVAGFLGTLFMTEKKTSYILVSTVIAAMINLFFAREGAVFMGIRGAVVILAFSFFMLMVIRLVQLKHSFQVSLSAASYGSCITILVSLLLYKYIDSIFVLIIYVLVLAILYLWRLQGFLQVHLVQMIQKNK